MTKLKEIRRKKRLLLREVADALGVIPQAVHGMETKGIRTVSAAKRYAKVLGVSWKTIIED